MVDEVGDECSKSPIVAAVLWEIERGREGGRKRSERGREEEERKWKREEEELGAL